MLLLRETAYYLTIYIMSGCMKTVLKNEFFKLTPFSEFLTKQSYKWKKLH